MLAERSAFGRAALGALATLLLLLVAVPAAADPAKALAAEARSRLAEVRDADARRRVALLEAALDRLHRIEREHPASEVARRLRAGEMPGLDPATIEAALARARTAPALAIDCARAADRACLLERAEALIDQHRLSDGLAELGRERARGGDLEAAEAGRAALDAAGDLLGASTVVAAIAGRLAASGDDAGAQARIERRVRVVREIAEPSERVHRLVSFGANLAGDGVVDLARPVFAAAVAEADAAIAAVPPSAAAEAVLAMYRAQALAGLGRVEAALEVMSGLDAGPLEAGWLGLAALLAKLGHADSILRIKELPAFADDWRINTALVEAAARRGAYRTAVDLAGTASRGSNRWLRLRAIAVAMAARGDAEPAAAILSALERGAKPQHLLGLAALWREVGRPDEAARLRQRFLDALVENGGERLEQPVATSEEAAAVAGWTLALARTFEPG